MNVPREVILDLVPVYLAGEASAATRALVEEYMQRDPELAEAIRRQGQEDVSGLAPGAPPSDLEMKSLQRTRSMIAWQRRLFGFGIAFTAIALTTKISFRDGRITDIQFLIREHPAEFGLFAVLAIACWTGYFMLRSRLRT